MSTQTWPHLPNMAATPAPTSVRTKSSAKRFSTVPAFANMTCSSRNVFPAEKQRNSYATVEVAVRQVSLRVSGRVGLKDEFGHVVHFEWLRDDAIRPKSQRALRNFGGAVRRHHDDGARRRHPAYRRQQVEVVRVRQTIVQQDHVERNPAVRQRQQRSLSAA